jgi:hypothetical protein
MKKSSITLAVIAGVAFVGTIGAISVVSANAQTAAQDPTATPQPWGMFGSGHMWGNSGDVDGPLHDYLIEAFANAIGMSPSELETRLAAGETLSAIAQAQGFTVDEFRTMIVAARQSAIEGAQADGVLTQAQAQLMLGFMNRVGESDGCPMRGDPDDATRLYGGMGMFGNRGGNGGFRRP